MNSIYIWSKNFSHSICKKSEVKMCTPVSSIYIWGENLVAESEAKDGGN